MGIFDRIFRKKTESTFPENELEQCLMEAANSISAQKDFYQKLIWKELFVLTDDQPDTEEGTQVLEADTTVRFVTFEGGAIPIFTATNRIFDKGVIKDEVPYIGLQGKDLFEIAKGAKFWINPYSEYGKELTPVEIESLMDGSIFDKIDKQAIEDKKNEPFNELFNSAGEKQEGLIYLEVYKAKKLKKSEKAQLEASVIDFQKCLEIIPDHWQSMFLMAKSLQRLDRHVEALEQLEAAFKLDLENHLIPMEAAIEAMYVKDLDKALFYSKESLKRNPEDFALMGNHAMNLLISSKDQEALDTIEQALKIAPKDSVNKNIKSIVQKVISGDQKRPSFEDTIR